MPARHTRGRKRYLSLGSLSLLEVIKLLLLEGGGAGELEVDIVGGQSLVAMGEGLKLGLHKLLVEGVKEDSLESLALKGDTGLTAGDGGGGDDVLKSSGVHSLEGSGSGAHLGGVVLG